MSINSMSLGSEFAVQAHKFESRGGTCQMAQLKFRDIGMYAHLFCISISACCLLKTTWKHFHTRLQGVFYRLP